ARVDDQIASRQTAGGSTYLAQAPRRSALIESIRLIEQFDQVTRFHVALSVAQPLLQLKQTAGIGRDNDVRAGALDVVHLSLEDFHAHISVHKIVDAGATA